MKNNMSPPYLLHKERSVGQGKLETFFSLNNKPKIQKCLIISKIKQWNFISNYVVTLYETEKKFELETLQCKDEQGLECFERHTVQVSSYATLSFSAEQHNRAQGASWGSPEEQDQQDIESETLYYTYKIWYRNRRVQL